MIFRLRDGVSSKLERINRTQQKAHLLAQKTQQRFKSLGNRMRGFFQRVARDAEAGAQRFQASMGKIRTSALAAFSVAGLLLFGQTILSTAQRVDGLNRSIAFASGADAQKNMSFLNDTVKSLGLDTLAAKEGFAVLAGSFKGTRLEGEPMRKLFTGVASAASALTLTADQSKGAFIALGQIMSKGKVSAEELRGQLGERIPGAFQIAARAMGMTTAELDKALSTGQIMSEDFLPKFATELQRTFGKAAQENANSLTARINRMKNSFLEAKLAVFDLAEPLFNLFIMGATYIMENFRPAMEWVVGFFQRWGVVIAAVTGFLAAYQLYLGIIALATKTWTALQWLLNAALNANPIGLVIGLIAGIIAAIVVAYAKFDAFRGLLHGVWEAFKSAFGSIGDLAAAVGEILVGAVTFDPDKIEAGLNKFKNTVANAGGSIAESFRKGYEDGVNKKVELPDFLRMGQSAQSAAAGPGLSLPGSNDPAEDLNSPGASRTGAQVNQGGSRPITANITFEKFQDQLVINTQSIQETAEEIIAVVEEALLRSVNSANQVAIR